MFMERVPRINQADGYGGTRYHRFLKKHKNRIERRRAKLNPFYQGYEL